MREILLVSDGLFHPPLSSRRILHKLLAAEEEARVHRLRSLDQLPADLHRYDALVLYFHHKRASAQALSQLEAYLAAGGGLLALHSATASFKQQPQYARMLGGSFAGHGRVGTFECRPAAEPGVFQGLPAFRICDELYLHEFEPGISVQYEADHEGEAVPVVWTHRIGAGRVCVAVPGHTVSAVKNAVYQQVLLRALRWVSQA